MREMNLLDVVRPNNNRDRLKVIKTTASRKIRPEDEMVILMQSARNKFKKTIDSGRIEIVKEREWTLR
ncbi:hypothetical protein [Paenibacillus crassostreae]|uniref:Uncharacterized protein n=1 Tax=Paenibacillus crassostreae TaxID=1763538 RepID=A0A167DWW2_9BACL|nr:hypothetical protein [Paenibacillus crassostreae]AOZ90965.1 hypothetical protein LPB68_01275 [Paenibacillus crassostreae]OAB74872.1 hypothetical protein PNBC_12680 [Paenibacillus crassostreae]